MLAGFENPFFGAAIELGAETVANGVAHRDQATNACSRLAGQVVERTEDRVLADTHHPIVQAVGVGLDVIRRRNGLLRRRFGQFDPLRVIDARRKRRDCRGERVGEHPAVPFQGWLVVPIHPPGQLKMSEHQVGTFDEIFVDRDSLPIVIRVLQHLSPGRSLRGLARMQLPEHDDVRCHLGAGVLFEGGVGQANGPKELRIRGQILPECGVHLVHRSARRNEHHQAPGPDLVQRFGEEVVVNREPVGVEAWVVDGIIAEGHVGDRHVVESVGKLGAFEPLPANVRVRVERFGDANRERVNLDAGDGRVPVHSLGHEAEKMANATRRFQNPAMFESEPLQGAIHGPDHSGRGVVRIEGARASRRQLLRGQQLLQLGARLSPFVIPWVKDLGHRAPTHVSHED